MKRKTSRSAYFVQRIPADVKAKVAGQRLAIPLGDGFKFVTPSARSNAIPITDRSTSVDLKCQVAATSGNESKRLMKERH
jgi:hypothetical protein